MRKSTLIVGICLVLFGFFGLSVLTIFMGAPKARYAPPGYGSKGMSNGKRIFLYGIDNSRRPITPRHAGMRNHMRRRGRMAMMSCASCHGADGRGGRLKMMHGSIKVEDIRWKHLRREGYDAAKLRRAIRNGIDARGKRLEFPMPEWSMPARNLEDLVDYLRTL